MDLIIVGVVRCHRQTFVNTSKCSRVRKYLRSRGLLDDCYLLQQGCPLSRDGEHKCTEHRLLEAALCRDSPVVEGDQQPVPCCGPTVTGCGRPRFVLS